MYEHGRNRGSAMGREPGTAGNRDQVGVPGRGTLVESLDYGTAVVQPKRDREPGTNEPPAGLAQTDVDFDPVAIQVDQYAPKTDLDRVNDCGPTVVLMVIRSINAETSLQALVLKDLGRLPGAEVTLQDELTFIRGQVAMSGDPAGERKKNPAAAVDTALSVSQVLVALIQILVRLGIRHTEVELRKLIVMMDHQAGFVLTNDMDSGTDRQNDRTHPGAQGMAARFLATNCGGGSAVIVLGKPSTQAWGWGGTDDPDRRRVPSPGDPESSVPQTITIKEALTDRHFVYVWAPSPGHYTVMDPSWSAPKADQTIDRVLAFIRATGGDSYVHMMVVPFGLLRASMPPAKQPKRDATAKRVAMASSIVSGPGAAVPRLTLGKMERAFEADFSAVRVHEDDKAGSMGMLGYAQGNELHFAPGLFRPGTAEGDRLIGHELAHVLQQRQGRVPMRSSGVVDDPTLEAEADTQGNRAAAPMAPPQTVAASAKTSGSGHIAGAPVTLLAGPLDAKLLANVVKAYPQGDQITATDAHTEFGTAVMALWHSADITVPDRTAVQNYLHSNVEPTLKRQTIGQLTAARARLEFFLGWLLQGGIRMNGTNWENGGGTNANESDSTTNAGTIVSEYTRTQLIDGKWGGYGLANADWCGMFVGFAMHHAGLAINSTTYLALASVPRALEWVKQQKAHGGLGTGGLEMTADDIWSGHATPQPGDVVILEHHVSMVERFDVATKTIETVDGNVGLLFNRDYAANGASGATYTKAGGPMKILLVYRPGLETFGVESEPTTTATGQAADPAAGLALVSGVQRASQQLTDLYGKLHLPGAIDDTKSVAQIATNTAIASPVAKA